MGLMFWPIVWIVFMLALCTAFGVVAMKDAKARAKLAKDKLASQQAMAGVGAEMAPTSEGGFDDGFGQPAEFAEFDENAFK